MNDSIGLSQIYTEIRPKLFRLLVARTGDAALAEDLLQDLWVRIQGRPSGPVAHPSAYLCRMAMNLATDHARSAQQRARREENWADADTETHHNMAHDLAPNAERVLIGKQELARVLKALEELPPRAAEIFQMHRIEGLAHTEIATHLGISRSAVEKSMAVALRHLFIRLKAGVLGDA